MASRSFILFADDSQWRVAISDGADRPKWIEVPVASGEPVDPIAEQLHRVISSHGYRGEMVLLAIPSKWCFAASIASADLPQRQRRRDRAAMLFRLEEKLPLSAEEIVADFVDAGEQSLGICARLDQLRPLVDALESSGVAVESVAPAALLAGQALVRSDDPQLMLLGEADAVNVIAMEHGCPILWSLAPGRAEDVNLHVAMARTKLLSSKTTLCDLPPQLAGALSECEAVEGSMHDAAVRAGRLVLLRRGQPWIDLRRGALAARDRLRAHRRALNAALAAAALLLLALAGVMLLRAQRYERSLVRDEQQLVDAFRSEFAGWTVPPNVRAVIDSEHGKLAAQQAGAAQQASSESALRTLARVLGAIPAASESRMSVDHMTFDDRGFTIDGRIAALADLDTVTSAIRGSGLRVAPPQTDRIDDGTSWRFSLRGEVSTESRNAPRVAELRP